MESRHFWPSVLHDRLYKTLFFNFWFRPPNAQNLLPKICTKSLISRLVWHIDRRCLGIPGGFRGWPIQWNHAKCCAANLVAMATKFGLKSPITRLVWQIDRRCLHLPGGFRGWPIQWNHTKFCGPTLVAMATKFGQIWATFLHKSAYKSACMAHRPEMFGSTRGPTRGADPCCHGNDIWPRRGDLVAYRLVLFCLHIVRIYTFKTVECSCSTNIYIYIYIYDFQLVAIFLQVIP